MRRALGVFVCVLLLGACSSKKEEPPAAAQAAATPAQTPAERSAAAAAERRRVNTAVAKSGIPMTGAIGKAMNSADAASAQAAAHDSVLESMK